MSFRRDCKWCRNNFIFKTKIESYFLLSHPKNVINYLNLKLHWIIALKYFFEREEIWHLILRVLTIF
jgi:hypothetical protein